MSEKVYPTGNMFYKQIRRAFADCWDSVKNLTDLSSNTDVNAKGPGNRLNSNVALRNTLVSLFSFYAGRILEDGEETGLYTGPAEHRVRTILSSYVNDACCLGGPAKDSVNNDFRQCCYDDIRKIGCSLNRAHEIYSKKE